MKKQPSQSFGPGFPRWLSIVEKLEDYVEGKTKRWKVPRGLAFSDNLFILEKGDFLFNYPALIAIWVQNAEALRNSFKFSLGNFTTNFIKGQEYTVSIYLPFERVYFQHETQLESGQRVTQMYLCERRTVTEHDLSLGLPVNEHYISIQPATIRGKQIIIDPIEIHLRPEETWRFKIAADHAINIGTVSNDNLNPEDVTFSTMVHKGIDASGWNVKDGSMWVIGRFCAFLALLNQSNIKQSLRGKVKPENVIRRKPAHKKQHPFYEYRVLELDVNPEPDTAVNVQVPREQPKKRLHAVRGFLRHYKKPLKSGPNAGKTTVFVKEHWRGEKDLGVIRKDYAISA